MQGLEKAPEQRPQGMREVETRLRTMAASLASASVLVSATPPAPSRRRSVAATLAVATVCGVGFGGYLALPGSPRGSGVSAHAATAPASPAPTVERDVPFTDDLRVATTLVPLAPASASTPAPLATAGATRRAGPARGTSRGAPRAATTVATPAPARAAQPARAKARLDRGGVMDPFAD